MRRYCCRLHRYVEFGSAMGRVCNSNGPSARCCFFDTELRCASERNIIRVGCVTQEREALRLQN